LYKNQPKS